MQAAKAMAEDARYNGEIAREKAMAMRDSMSEMKFAFAPQIGQGQGFGGGKTPPAPPAPAVFRRISGMNDDSLYSNGQRALDNRQWDQAVEYFSQVASRNGARADGALYWKAYALGRVGKRRRLAAIAELRKSTQQPLARRRPARTRMRQASGQTVSPEVKTTRAS